MKIKIVSLLLIFTLLLTSCGYIEESEVDAVATIANNVYWRYKADVATATEIPATPTSIPTIAPTLVPTLVPTLIPTSIPTLVPTLIPTLVPPATSTLVPSSTQTLVPTATLTSVPTNTLIPPIPTNTSTSTAVAGTFHVYPGQSLRTAINSLVSGNTLYVHGGTYTETLNISKTNITIIGLDNPIIKQRNVGVWGVLLNLTGSYITMSGFEVTDSDYMGVKLAGHHIVVSGFNVHHNYENGILITGDNNIVENSKVWQNCYSNLNGSRTRGGWSSGLSAARYPNNAIIRNNEVYNNWGEGLSTYEANGTLIEGNRVYDNYVNMYISDVTNAIIKDNQIWIPTNPVVKVGARVGIMMGDEKYNPPSSNIQILNNTVTGTHRNFYWWQGLSGGGLVNVLIKGNTFSESAGTTNVQINSGTHANLVFEGNTVKQTGILPIAIIVNCSQITFKGNTWNKVAPCPEI